MAFSPEVLEVGKVAGDSANRRRPTSVTWHLVANMILGAAVFAILVPFSLLDFDPYHDGLLLAPAIAVRDGSVLFSDVFTHFGPITSWTQAGFLALWPGPEATGLRIFSAGLIGIIAFFLADLGRIAPRYWGLKPQITFTASALWALSFDGLYGAAVHPWPSLTALALVSGGLYFFAASDRADRCGSQISLAILAGVLFGAVFFTRQRAGAVLLLVVLAGLLIRRFDSSSKKELAWVATGFGFSTLVILGTLMFRGSLGDWFAQAILYPLEWGEANSAFWSPFGVLVIWTGLWAIIAAFVLRDSRLSPQKASIIVGVLFIVSTAVSSIYGEGFDAPHGFYEAYRQDWTAALLNHNFSSLTFLFFLSATLVGFKLWEFFLKSATQMPASAHQLILVAAALSPFAQSLPSPDTRHLWWAFPIGLVLLGSQLDQGRWRALRRSRAVKLAAGVTMLTSLLSAGANLLLVERYPYQSGTIAEGMWGREGNVKRFAAEAALVDRMDNSIPQLFISNEGHLSVLLGEYKSADMYFSTWGPTPPLEERLKGEMDLIVENGPELDRLLLIKGSELLGSDLDAGLSLIKLGAPKNN